MKRIHKIIISALVIFFVVGCGQQQQRTANDIVTEYPENAKVVFENDYVKAVEFMLEPGDKLPLHKGGKRVVYALSDYKVKWTEGDETSEKEWQKGDAHWHDAIEHAIENIGDTIASYMVVMRKDALLPETGEYDLSRDASQLDSEHSKIIFDNEHVRLIGVTLGSGESQPKHEGIYRLIYSLSDYKIEYTYNETNTVESQMEKGYVHWHAPDRHSVKNIGDPPAHYLIFAFKK
ncbi:hypothetical protein GF407_11445 [candidate division KSB1 bacterium]|nr:hypothetical protein [candidate division KSB1 bacterium]